MNIKLAATALAGAVSLAGCYYGPYGYDPYGGYYYPTVPAAATQQAVPVAPPPDAAAHPPPPNQPPPPPASAYSSAYGAPPAQYAVADVPSYSAYPAYAPAYPAYYPAYPAYYGYPYWGGPTVSIGVGGWWGGHGCCWGGWHGGGYWHGGGGWHGH